ncbi:MAG: DNA polymerase III subunit beta [Phycisphaerales bacterium]|jgi:DNA polymerase-3 subunit beta|nr:DNA polymerase III subunit beta [Phycisphaerales bacterium]MDP6311733.1 DNA polymerase III subunit beta [Phycisphaerales bacterium]MDP7086134.1 DNA polymerase III subunit beta [Phycisphaerales bacterium]MDP7189533.1 DNA polymerase III subunit beta [Phycisphaerales bacterium]MDP7519945.1 DNA polymerase III subunit beta [Phycisphaerales bacterium]|tara:strand:- start:576 stop:1691 length:1116 start_codon:yes stop_codon:yes gene_type:complete
MALKVICDQGALADALNTVSAVVASRTPTPVLTCIKLTGENGRLRLAATDGEISLQLDLDRVEVDSDGESLVPADKLTQIVRECADPTVALEAEGHALHINAGDSHFKVYGFDPAEAPPLEPFDEAAMDCTIDSGTLAGMVSRSLFAAAVEHTRYAINGVLFDRDGKRIRFVATDGRRLAMASGDCKGESGTRQCIIPGKALSLIRRLVTDPETPVRVAVDDNRITLCFDDPDAPATLGSALVEGRFPPFEDVIPKDQDKKVLFDRDTLRSAIRRASLLTNEESRSVRMKFEPSKLTLTSHAPEMGEAVVHLELKDYTGDTLEIGFNPTYIADALKVIDSQELTFEFKAANKPGLIRAGRDFTYVLMPVNA